MRASGAGLIAAVAFAKCLTGCASFDAQLVNTSEKPPAYLSYNGTIELLGCAEAGAGTRVEGGFVDMSRGLPPAEANWWVKQHGVLPLPLVNEAFSIGCGRKLERVPYVGTVMANAGQEFWVYSNASDSIALRTKSAITLLEPELAVARMRLGDARLRILLAAICEDTDAPSSFAFAGVFDSDTVMSRAVVALPCHDSADDLPNLPKTESAIRAGVAVAIHEAAHGINEIRFTPDRQNGYVSLADEVLATLISAEFDGRDMVLPVLLSEPPPDLPCEFELPNNPQFAPPRVGSDFGDRDGVNYRLMSEDFANYMSRVFQALVNTLEGRNDPNPKAYLSAEQASMLLDQYGTDLNVWHEIVADALGCSTGSETFKSPT